MSKITVRIPLDRPPTFEDRQQQIGMDEFEKRLIEAGWADEDGNVLKPLRVTHEGHIDDGQFYIEWTATLKE